MPFSDTPILGFAATTPGRRHRRERLIFRFSHCPTAGSVVDLFIFRGGNADWGGMGMEKKDAFWSLKPTESIMVRRNESRLWVLHGFAFLLASGTLDAVDAWNRITISSGGNQCWPISASWILKSTASISSSKGKGAVAALSASQTNSWAFQQSSRVNNGKRSCNMLIPKSKSGNQPWQKFGAFLSGICQWLPDVGVSLKGNCCLILWVCTLHSWHPPSWHYVCPRSVQIQRFCPLWFVWNWFMMNFPIKLAIDGGNEQTQNIIEPPMFLRGEKHPLKMLKKSCS